MYTETQGGSYPASREQARDGQRSPRDGEERHPEPGAGSRREPPPEAVVRSSRSSCGPPFELDAPSCLAIAAGPDCDGARERGPQQPAGRRVAHFELAAVSASDLARDQEAERPLARAD